MLLADFKTSIDVTGTSKDDYYIDYFLKPAIDRAATLSLNIKQTTVTLTNGTQSYDLTSSSIASPVVSSAGIQELVWDDDIEWSYSYKMDFFIDDLTTLYFVDSDTPITGEFEFKYNGFWTKPTGGATPTETDMPTRLFPAVLKWANAEYGIKQIGTMNSNGGVASKNEENMSVSYGSIAERNKVYQDQKHEAEMEMVSLGAGAKFSYMNSSVI